jgi:hypothetical protein
MVIFLGGSRAFPQSALPISIPLRRERFPLDFLSHSIRHVVFSGGTMQSFLLGAADQHRVCAVFSDSDPAGQGY